MFIKKWLGLYTKYGRLLIRRKKMRLIDADILKQGNRTIHDNIIVLEKDIDRCPTVKAIPMGWISEYSRKPISNADYWAIMRMVTEWEKENARD
jgi:hypothetical protein